MKTLRALRRTVAQIYRLARLSSGGPGWQTGLLLCGLILAAKLADIYITVAIINWSKAFFDALEKVNVSESVRQVGIFFLLIGISASIFLAAQYVQKIVFIRWRSRLNSIVLSAWLDDKAYWKLQPSFSEGGIENPDQRISEDCRLFVDALWSRRSALSHGSSGSRPIFGCYGRSRRFRCNFQFLAWMSRSPAIWSGRHFSMCFCRAF